MENTLGNSSRICVITTGGEITHARNNPGSFTVADYEDPRVLFPTSSDYAQTDVIRMDLKPGEDILEPSIELARTIHARLDEYDGFLVTAGKHQIESMAPVISFALGPTLSKTVAIVGANIPAFLAHSDAKSMIGRGLMAAKAPFKEVAIVFRDLVVRGSSYSLEHIGGGNMAYVPYMPGEHLAEITETLDIEHLRANIFGQDAFTDKFSPGVLFTEAIPGLNGSLVDRFLGNGLILVSQGQNTVPTEPGPYSLIPPIQRLSEIGTPVVIVSKNIAIHEAGRPIYNAETEASKAGAIIARDMNPLVATAKLRWALGRVNTNPKSSNLNPKDRLEIIRGLMTRPYVGEFGIKRPFSSV